MSLSYADQIIAAHLQIIGNDQCWICEKVSPLTREHKIKATWFKNFGLQTDLGYFGENGKEKHIQSKKSDKLKYEKYICQHCNGALTKPYDVECDKLFDMIKCDSNIGEIKRFTNGNFNLKRYFAKLLGCRMQAENISLTKNLRNFLFDCDEFKNYFIKLSHNDLFDNNSLAAAVDPLNVDILDLQKYINLYLDSIPTKLITKFYSTEYYGKFKFEHGFVLDANEQAAYMAKYNIIVDNQRLKFVTKC